jgi:hypothetical protein
MKRSIEKSLPGKILRRLGDSPDSPRSSYRQGLDNRQIGPSPALAQSRGADLGKTLDWKLENVFSVNEDEKEKLTTTSNGSSIDGGCKT